MVYNVTMTKILPYRELVTTLLRAHPSQLSEAAPTMGCSEGSVLRHEVNLGQGRD